MSTVLAWHCLPLDLLLGPDCSEEPNQIWYERFSVTHFKEAYDAKQDYRQRFRALQLYCPAKLEEVTTIDQAHKLLAANQRLVAAGKSAPFKLEEALFWSIVCDRIVTARILLNLGANPNLPNQWGILPILMVRSVAMLTLLRRFKVNLHALSLHGANAAAYASIRKDLPLLNELLRLGVQIVIGGHSPVPSRAR